MAMIRVDPVEVHVRTGWFDGSPREITWGDERLPVTRLNAVREEAAAYPVITGPRTLFDVETSRARLALTYQHRSRRWTITALDDDGTLRDAPDVLVAEIEAIRAAGVAKDKMYYEPADAAIATVAAPTAYSRIRSQPMIQATSSPMVA